MGYIVYSPDGFNIQRDKVFDTKEEAEKGLKEWVKQYEKQGYYSTSNREKLLINEIEDYCSIKEI